MRDDKLQETFTGTPQRSDPGVPLSRVRKRLFIGLISVTGLILCLLLVIGWVIPSIGFWNIHVSVPYIVGGLLLILVLLIIWATLSMVLQVVTGRTFFGFARARGIVIKFFLPLMEMLGRLVGIPKLEVRRSFIKVNNEMVQSETKPQEPSRVLILLPHCLQWSECAIRINNRVENCKQCGRCNIAGLLGLARRYGVNIAIATGGTIARRIVVEKRPRLILAVACERDLSSGIKDTYPLPVYGVLNERPHGPCNNTLVDLPLVEEALRAFILPEYLPEQLPEHLSERLPMHRTEARHE